MSLTLAGATLGGGLGSGIISGLSSLFGQKSQFNEQKKLLELQYQKNLEQWNRENEYNSPAKQMERLKAAGLNANLVYGNGGVTQQAANSPSYNVPEAPDYGTPFAKMMQTAFLSIGNFVQQMAMNNSQLSLNQSQEGVNDANAAKLEQEALLSQYRSQAQKRQNKWIDIMNLTDLSESLSKIKVNNTKVELNKQLVTESIVTCDFIKHKTNLTDAQIASFNQQLRESAARVLKVFQDIQESKSRVSLNSTFGALNMSNVHLNNARTAAQLIDNDISRQTKFWTIQGQNSRNLIDMNSWRWIVSNKKFQALNGNLQYNVMSRWLDKKTQWTVNKLMHDANKVEIYGLDAGNLFNWLLPMNAQIPAYNVQP